MNMQGKVAVIAAGASGIGRATALAFAKRGAQVAIIDLNKDAASAVADDIRAAGGTAHAYAADCGVVSEIERVAAEISDTVDHVDFLFNNVGMPNPHGIDGITEEQWQRSIDVNLKSGFFLTQQFLPLIRKSGRGGSIVFTSSAAGLTGSYTTPLYSLTKAGVIGFVKSLAAHLAPEGIRVNAVCPGPVRTPMLAGFMQKGADATDEVAKLYSSRVPLGRVAEAEEIAQAVVFLASDEASYITGVPLPVDGGYVAI
jgi:NAD(P)-dependent dehydrogenase (short-subunit alcohol dehydrogenase family)